MPEWLQFDILDLFRLHRSLPESLLRGTLIYLALYVLLRFAPKRQVGKLAPSDLLILVLIGEVAGGALHHSPMSITDVVLVVLTIHFWSYALDWLGFRFPRLRPWLEASPTPLIQDGRPLVRNLRREMITEEELLAQLRKQGTHRVEAVRRACLEADGTVSVERADEEKSPADTGGGTTAVAAGGGEKTDGRPAVGKLEAEEGSRLPDAIPGEEPQVARFLEAARHLQERLRRHEEAVRAIKRALADHGVRLRPSKFPARNARAARAEGEAALNLHNGAPSAPDNFPGARS